MFVFLGCRDREEMCEMFILVLRISTTLHSSYMHPEAGVV